MDASMFNVIIIYIIAKRNGGNGGRLSAHLCIGKYNCTTCYYLWAIGSQIVFSEEHCSRNQELENPGM